LLFIDPDGAELLSAGQEDSHSVVVESGVLLLGLEEYEDQVADAGGIASARIEAVDGRIGNLAVAPPVFTVVADAHQGHGHARLERFAIGPNGFPPVAQELHGRVLFHTARYADNRLGKLAFLAERYFLCMIDCPQQQFR